MPSHGPGAGAGSLREDRSPTAHPPARTGTPCPYRRPSHCGPIGARTGTGTAAGTPPGRRHRRARCDRHGDPLATERTGLAIEPAPAGDRADRIAASARRPGDGTTTLAITNRRGRHAAPPAGWRLGASSRTARPRIGAPVHRRRRRPRARPVPGAVQRARGAQARHRTAPGPGAMDGHGRSTPRPGGGTEGGRPSGASTARRQAAFCRSVAASSQPGSAVRTPATASMAERTAGAPAHGPMRCPRESRAPWWRPGPHGRPDAPIATTGCEPFALAVWSCPRWPPAVTVTAEGAGASPLLLAGRFPLGGPVRPRTTADGFGRARRRTGRANATYAATDTASYVHLPFVSDWLCVSVVRIWGVESRAIPWQGGPKRVLPGSSVLHDAKKAV